MNLDLTGQVFDRLTVIRQVPRPENSNIKNKYWLCKCSCGNEKIVCTSLLTGGKTRSCGCLIGEKNKKSNKYDLTGKYGICYSANTNEPILFDLEDYDKIKDYCWYISFHNNKKDKRVRTNIRDCNNKRTTLFMHKLIMPNDFMVIDHINRDPLDNRKSNLRICTQAQNTYNRKGNGGIYKGVQKRKYDGKWIASIGYNGSHYYIGAFDTPELAALAYNEKAKEFFGEFAYLNDVHFDNEINTIAN